MATLHKYHYGFNKVKQWRQSSQIHWVTKNANDEFDQLSQSLDEMTERSWQRIKKTLCPQTSHVSTMSTDLNQHYSQQLQQHHLVNQRTHSISQLQLMT